MVSDESCDWSSPSDCSSASSCSHPQNQPSVRGESFCDGDLFVLRPEGPVAGPSSTAAVTQSTPRLLCHPPGAVLDQSDPVSAPPTTAVAVPSTCLTHQQVTLVRWNYYDQQGQLPACALIVISSCGLLGVRHLGPLISLDRYQMQSLHFLGH